MLPLESQRDSSAGRDMAQEIGPTGLPFGCNCDPYDDGPASHDDDCPALAREPDWMNANRSDVPLLDALLREMRNQDRQYGRFRPDVAGIRLAAAALEDEAEEVKRAWRDERQAEGWEHTAEEALQVAAVALRLVRDAVKRR